MASNPSGNANSDEKWYFSKERLENSPSKNAGIDGYKELQYRQQAANFIQDMGQRLKVYPFLCVYYVINLYSSCRCCEFLKTKVFSKLISREKKTTMCLCNMSRYEIDTCSFHFSLLLGFSYKRFTYQF